MSDLTFCFGFTGDFYFYSPERPLSSIIWARATKDFAKLTDVNRPLCVALGPNLDWFFGYQAIDGQMKWTRRREQGPNLKHGSFYKSWSARQAAYDNLESWLRLHASKSWDMAQTKVSIGPKGSCFATFPGARATWSSIPSSLERLIDLEQPSRTPTLVTLGVKETWFALWRDGNGSCNLDSEYQKLEELLRRHGKLGVNSIALSPSQSNQFAVSFRDGSSHIRGPVSEGNLRQLNAIMVTAAQSSQQPLAMQVQVCGLHTSSPPIELPTQLLNMSKITFPGSPGDRIGREYEPTAKGVQKRAKAATFVAINSSNCMIM
ncbi:hypothetical protein HO173_009533 [Letharia columbiana]|uniref:Uncharacterized protein n=1 Tax=Letharia columbiana TaxID=112416 RepID=A0A8H6FP79_9LECA|nr:uncharacterized protein HO173_009533 [Letharia columbiana]KAF6232150.1 hypothetical protein HO173_009533 [Letharia columbiana]